MVAAGRPRGRPRRDVRSKRDALIDAARIILRRNPPVHVPRSEIAGLSDTTPAMMTYYFKNEAELVVAAAQPIVDAYLGRLLILLNNGAPPALKFGDLVELLLEIGRDNGQLLESYINYVKHHQTVGHFDFLSRSYAAMDLLFQQCVAEGILPPVNTAFLQTALWGVCRAVAQNADLARYLEPAGDDDRLARLQVDLVLAMLMRGGAPPR